MNLHAFHTWFLVSACALLCAVVLWIPAAGALHSGSGRAAWASAIVALVGLVAYARARRARRGASSVEAA